MRCLVIINTWFLLSETVGSYAVKLIDKTNVTWSNKPKPKPKPVPTPSNPSPGDLPGLNVSANTVDVAVFGTRILSSDGGYELFGFSLGVSSSAGLTPYSNQLNYPSVHNFYASTEWIAIGAPHGVNGNGRVQVCQGQNISNCYGIIEESSRWGTSGLGYSLGFSNNGSVFLTTAMTKRRLFTTDWDYVIINDVHIFLYEKIADSNMVLKQTLLIRSENEGIDMPVSLAMYEDSFVVGLPWLSYSSFQGHAYIYKFSTSSDRYDLVADLISSEESPDDDAFGTAVALSSKQVFIGASEANSGQGAVYLYSDLHEESKWTLMQIILPPDNSTDGFFGYSLTTSTPFLLYVGAPGSDDRAGYVFAYKSIQAKESSQYKLTAAIAASDGHVNDMFGYSLSSAGSMQLAIGAPGHSMYGESAGAVYLYDIATWKEQKKYVLNGITEEDDRTDDTSEIGFGITVALSDNAVMGSGVLVVGANRDYGTAAGSGAVYMINTTLVLTSSPNYSKNRDLSVVLLCLVLAIPITTIFLYFFYRMRTKKQFERVSASGSVIDLRLDIEEPASTSYDEYDTNGNPVLDGIFFLNTPQRQKPETRRDPNMALTPVHIPGRCSADNPFRRVSTASPASSPFAAGGPSTGVIIPTE